MAEAPITTPDCVATLLQRSLGTMCTEHCTKHLFTRTSLNQVVAQQLPSYPEQVTDGCKREVLRLMLLLDILHHQQHINLAAACSRKRTRMAWIILKPLTLQEHSLLQHLPSPVRLAHGQCSAHIPEGPHALRQGRGSFPGSRTCPLALICVRVLFLQDGCCMARLQA